MNTLLIDFTAIAAILVAGALLMVPVLGITLRLALPPIIEAVARARSEAARGAVPYEAARDAARDLVAVR